ncbi:MAG TPA: glycosyltransferase [Bacteroidales bacterium]|nr:glycosyltransferase [Bacteroidales bacterium]
MNILLLNTHNPFKASGVVALDLLKQFRQTKHNVKLLVNSWDAEYPDDIISLETSNAALLKSIKEKIEWRINLIKRVFKIKNKVRTDPDYPFFHVNEKKRIYRTKRILRAAGENPDIIIVLFAKGFINTRNIFEMNRMTGARIYWLMYDMAPFTGGCHYAWQCTGYQHECGQCPGLYSSDPHDPSYFNLKYKKKYTGMTDLELLAGSEWQFRQASASTLFKNKVVHKLLLPVNSDIFKPVDKAALREKLGLPVDRKIIFFGAVGLSENRKGMRYLIDSLQKLKEITDREDCGMGEEILLLIAGRNADRLTGMLPFESHYMGFLDNSEGIASAYQVADIFLCPSIEDSGPMMINQSVMAGTPVVSFEMGVSLDLVINGETGYRAGIMDINDMAMGLHSLLNLDRDSYSELSSACRAMALNKYSFDSWMNQFIKITGEKLKN